MTKKERVEQELRKRIEAADFGKITIQMKCNGDTIVITPCCWSDESSWKTAEYFLVDSQYLPWLGADTIEKVADEIARYEELLKERTDSVNELKAYIKENAFDSDWSWVSDWHKDLFGHRPHVGQDKLVRWAYSDSTDSVRLF